MRYRLFVPVVSVFLLLLGFGFYLVRDGDVTPALLDKRPFSFAPQDLYDESIYYDESIFLGKVSLVNIFASWCVPCVAEHPFITALGDDGKLQMVGLNWKDERVDGQAFLAKYGNPYDITTYDWNGRTAIDWGSEGIPETYIVDGEGIIRYKHIGPILDEAIVSEILKLAEDLR